MSTTRHDISSELPHGYSLPFGVPAAVLLALEVDDIKTALPCGRSHAASKLLDMTPHGRLKAEVGVRELHDQLSRYVRHAAEGGEVVVTMRGRRVARLSPIEVSDPLAELRARGLVQEPVLPKRRADARKRLVAAAPVSDLVAEQRR